MIKKMDELVNENVSFFAEDWFKLDRPRAVDETDYVVFLRETGVDTLFLSNHKSWDNLMWLKAGLDSGRAGKIFRCHDGKVEEITANFAMKLWREAMDTLPEGYREYHEKISDTRTPSIPIKEWDVVKWKSGGYLPVAD